MKKTMMILLAALLITGAASAQETSDSVESILKDLRTYTAPSAPAVADPSPGTTPASAAEEVAEPVVVEPLVVEPLVVEPEAVPFAAVDIAAVVEQSHAQFVGGEFAKAQAGFESVVKLDPENIFARMYLRTLKERDHRRSEIKGMKAVDAAWSTDLVFRSYALSGDACEMMGLDNVKKDAVDVAAVFTQVDFSKGASAIYEPNIATLFVRNTRDNLAVLEAILGAMDLAKLSTDVDQVEIEAKFVEVAEGTLEELGFQWNFDGSVEVGGTDLEVNDGTAGLFANALRGSPSGSSPDLPFSRTIDLGNGQISASGDWSSFRFTDTFNPTPSSITLENRGSNPVDILISALDQSTGTDVLSAPRIVVRSGEQATLRVGELHSYPDVIEGSTDQGTLLNVSYQDFQDKLLGVEMAVTPEVDGDQITLSLNPRITEIVGWNTYQLAPADSIYTHRLNAGGFLFDHAAIVGQLPIFKKREIETEVTIADGSTIGMGGLINERFEAFEDKVPVLGSIPLLGRLFRNEGERAVKRNLLMFVTAKRVEATGRINTSRSFE